MICPRCKKDDPQNREMCPECGVPIKPIPVPPGGKICFGGYDWFVLDKQDGKTLIITEKVIEKRSYYHEECAITWETCDMRGYLNGEFYNSFSEADRTRIAEVVNQNPDNPWDGTPGGNPTTDRIFLLSIEEVVKYLGDSGQLQAKPTGPKGESWWIDDQYNSVRLAKFGSKPAWWWIRSPGYIGSCAGYVQTKGLLHIHGGGVAGKNGGVRPALWLKD
ncbi:hypothetical protein FACS1894105_11760 [Clostridia bacterium]|nr:hypothetical protein FACS1894105_11760 [Clostridia bacterium]